MTESQYTAKYTALRFSGIFLGMLTRLFRSLIFNIFVFLVGFGAGYVFIAGEFHYYALKNDKYQCIEILENKLHQLRIIDKEIDETIREIKIKAAHDEHNCIFH